MISNPICKGCGQVMQDHDPFASNYVLNLDFELCMRCFRWRHYKDLPLLIQPITSLNHDHSVFELEVDEMMVVVDAMFLKETFVSLIHHLKDRENLHIIATKLDLYPAQIGKGAIQNEIDYYVKLHGLKVKHIWVTSTKIKSTINELKAYLLKQKADYRCLLVGMVNSGKSSLINALQDENQITTSAYPQTTLNHIRIPFGHIELIDSPGLSNEDHLFYHIDPKLYQKIIPQSRIRPKIYQIKGQVSIVVEDLFIINLAPSDKISVSLTMSNELDIRKLKYRENNHERLSDPNYKITKLAPSGEHLDFLVEGIGKVHVVGPLESVEIMHHHRLTISKYKGKLLW